MTFLQPYLLWMLPLVAVPVIIHLLNRMRYRSVAWAAMEFLFAATRQSTRQARLRHWLILLCRTLAVLAIILTLARPLVGGWLGWAFSGAPDTVVLLLDRSASMEQQVPELATTKRALAVQRLVEAATQLAGASRLVLIESGTRLPQEISTPAALTEVSLTAATDAAADIPGLLETAVDYVSANQCGQTEFWLASDWQASNWAGDGQRWSALMDRIRAVPQAIRVRLLGLTQPPGDNLGVTIPALARQKSGDAAVLDLTVEISHNRPDKMTFPLTLMVDGHRSVVEVKLEGPQMRLQQRVSLGEKSAGGHGWVELPPDTNPRDNRAYFAYNAETHLRAVVVSDDPRMARLLQVATVPAPSQMNQSADVVTPAELAGVKWEEVALVVESGNIEWLDVTPFGEAGGVVVVFPGSDQFESAGEDAPFRVTTWQDNDGPLANTQDGLELPVGDLRVMRRQVPTVDGTVLASFADGKPFLVRRPRGKGAVYDCATLPAREWSNLAEGTVLVPMLQRMMQEGGRRLGQVQEVFCGEEVAGAARDMWERLDEPGVGASRLGGTVPLLAGVYRVGGKIIPVNRPATEDEPDMLDEAKVRALFGAVPVRLLEEKTERGGRLQSEVWRLVLIWALLFLVGEGLLTMAVAASGGHGSSPPRSPPAATKSEPVPVEVGR